MSTPNISTLLSLLWLSLPSYYHHPLSGLQPVVAHVASTFSPPPPSLHILCLESCCGTDNTRYRRFSDPKSRAVDQQFIDLFDLEPVWDQILTGRSVLTSVAGGTTMTNPNTNNSHAAVVGTDPAEAAASGARYLPDWPMMMMTLPRRVRNAALGVGIGTGPGVRRRNELEEGAAQGREVGEGGTRGGGAMSEGLAVKGEDGSSGASMFDRSSAETTETEAMAVVSRSSDEQYSGRPHTKVRTSSADGSTGVLLEGVS